MKKSWKKTNFLWEIMAIDFKRYRIALHFLKVERSCASGKVQSLRRQS